MRFLPTRAFVVRQVRVARRVWWRRAHRHPHRRSNVRRHQGVEKQTSKQLVLFNALQCAVVLRGRTRKGHPRIMDSSLSASELRQRYSKGGSLSDSALSASQLRARHGVASNNKDFSTSRNSSSFSLLRYSLVSLVLAAVGAALYMYMMSMQK